MHCPNATLHSDLALFRWPEAPFVRTFALLHKAERGHMLTEYWNSASFVPEEGNLMNLHHSALPTNPPACSHSGVLTPPSSCPDGSFLIHHQGKEGFKNGGGNATLTIPNGERHEHLTVRAAISQLGQRARVVRMQLKTQLELSTDTFRGFWGDVHHYVQARAKQALICDELWNRLERPYNRVFEEAWIYI